MIFLRIIIIMCFILPVQANEIDDEIIKNLDFFENMDLIKENIPYEEGLSDKMEISE